MGITFLDLPREDQIRLKNSSKIAQAMENAWTAKISDAIEEFVPHIIQQLERTGRAPKIELEDLLTEHYFDVSIKSMRYAHAETEEYSYLPPGAGKRMGIIGMPKTLEALMRLYDLWKKGRYRSRGIKKIAKQIQTEYLKKVRSVWEEHSEGFRSGDANTQALVVKEIKEAAKTTSSRAKTIVRTNTTQYYNKARTEFYDQSEDITHYLFIAVRDAGTSPWCTPNTIKGYRGRSGLVYGKDDPLRKKEQPACHPNCRSEYLPLNRLNPAHLRFIQNYSIQRRNHVCYPLLKGWNQ